MDLKRMICVLTAVALLLPAIAVASANGSCKDWLGKWCITYFNTATTDNTTDKIHDNVTITTADNSTQTIGKFSYCCLAQGLRQSDSSPVSIVRQTVAQDDPPTIYIPENTYRYYLTADIVDLGPFDPFAQICAVNFYSTTFTTADLPFNCSGGTSSPDPGQEPNE